MATINVFKTNTGSLVFVVGELREDAPIVGVSLREGATEADAIAEIRQNIENLGGLFFLLQGGSLNLAKLQEHEPVLVTSFEAEDVDASDFEAAKADEEEAGE